MGTYRVYDSTFKQVTMSFEMGMEIDVGGGSLQRDHREESSEQLLLDPRSVFALTPTDGGIESNLKQLIGKKERSWPPSPGFEAKATLEVFTSLLGFSF